MLLDYVNAKIGSENEPRFSNGNIFPLTAMPHGTSGWTIQTSAKDGNWFYDPRCHAFEGLRLTHQPSPWVGDYGHVLFFPFSGEIDLSRGITSTFRPKDAVIRPDILSVYLLRYQLRVKLAPTVRGGVFSIENESENETSFAIFPFGESNFTLSGKTVSGYTDTLYCLGQKEVREYFYAEFSDVPYKESPLDKGGKIYTFREKRVTVKIAASFISVDQAKRNFTNELSGNFDGIREKATAEWEEKLGKIRVSGDKEKMRTFYSCLYRAYLYPRIFHEYDETGKAVHMNPDLKQKRDGVFYTDNGFWDTYRTVFPLLALIDRETYAEMTEGFVNFYEETGYLPKWISPGEVGMMPGTLVEAVIADAAVKSIIDRPLTERAYRGMLKNAYVPSGNGFQGRAGCEYYLEYGYLPRELQRESVNHTLDCAYGDFCVAQVAKLLGDNKKAAELYSRSENYKNIFDPVSGFMRGKTAEGKRTETFDPFSWGGDYCEGSAWQNSFAVYHDVAGLAGLYGGKEKLEARLDELFSAPPVFRVGGYGFEIHEMSEMAAIDFGQCAISNQPSFHIPYLYTLLGKREKTEYWVKKLVTEAFSSADDGFPGDEDNGTMAAWYIFSCLGFYPVCPGKNEYVCSAPLFDDITINGKKIGRFSPDTVTTEDIIG